MSDAPKRTTYHAVTAPPIGMSMAWAARAQCHAEHVPVAAFFPRAGSSTANVKAVCDRCPVKRECGEYATATHMQGIWGGLEPLERQRARRRDRRHAS